MGYAEIIYTGPKKWCWIKHIVGETCGDSGRIEGNGLGSRTEGEGNARVT